MDSSGGGLVDSVLEPLTHGGNMTSLTPMADSMLPMGAFNATPGSVNGGGAGNGGQLHHHVTAGGYHHHHAAAVAGHAAGVVGHHHMMAHHHHHHQHQQVGDLLESRDEQVYL